MEVCDRCGKTFRKVAWISYTEYPGASPQKEPVSPCCHAGYTEGPTKKEIREDEAAVQRAIVGFQIPIFDDRGVKAVWGVAGKARAEGRDVYEAVKAYCEAQRIAGVFP